MNQDSNISKRKTFFESKYLAFLSHFHKKEPILLQQRIMYSYEKTALTFLAKEEEINAPSQ